jgi:protein-disulfide isomerase
MRIERILALAMACFGLLAIGVYIYRRVEVARTPTPAPARVLTQVLDASALKPPEGAHVAIIEFEDMECPTCAYSNPILKKAAAQFGIPWIRRDFPLAHHVWSMKAAVNARWFDALSKQTGDEYRDEVFANQPSINTQDDLSAFTKRFAVSRKIVIPADVDPKGTLAAAVKADYDLGVRTGVVHTPTVWIVTDRGKGARYREASIDLHDLNEMIEQALGDTR